MDSQNYKKLIDSLLKKYCNIIGEQKESNISVEKIITLIINYYENLITNMPGNVYWLDKNCHAIGCNKNVLDMFGLKSISEFRGISFEEMGKIGKWDPKATQSFKGDSLEVLRTGKAKINIEEPAISHSDGRTIYFLSSRVPLFDDANNVIGVAGISIDITDRKLAEELKIKNEAAEKVIKFTNLMAGSMAHELRTPLSSINTYADLFKNELLSNNSKEEKENFCLGVYKKIKLIIKSTNHMINDMLFKLRSFAVGKLPQSNFIKLKMSDSVKKFMDTFPFAEKEKAVIKIIANEDFVYSGDELLTEHVLTNLVKNALKVIRENGWKGDLTIELRTDNNYNKLIVRDTAIGIPKEYLPKIFDQFETTNSKSGGTGLGLAFCKMVMEYYGGTITCNSREGKYTEFVLSFPKVE